MEIMAIKSDSLFNGCDTKCSMKAKQKMKHLMFIVPKANFPSILTFVDWLFFRLDWSHCPAQKKHISLLVKCDDELQ